MTWTYCGIFACGGVALMLVTDVVSKSTRALVAYTDEEPVKIRRVRGKANPMIVEVS